LRKLKGRGKKEGTEESLAVENEDPTRKKDEVKQS